MQGRTPLFPAVFSKSDDTTWPQIPAQQTLQNESKPAWLQNQSYTPAAAETALELQQKVDDFITVDKRATNEDVAVPKKRHHSPEARDLIDVIERNTVSSRKKKKDKHRHKHKHKTKKKKLDEKVVDLLPCTKNLKQPSVSGAGKVFIDEMPNLVAEHAFRIDRKSDQNNLIYSSLYKLHIGKYKSLGYSCLGLPNERIIVRETKPGKHIPARYYSKDVRKLVTFDSCPPIAKTVSCTFPGSDVDVYLPLSKTHTDVHHLNDAISGRSKILDKSTTLYLEGKGIPQQKPDSEINPPDRKNQANTEKVAYYNKTLHDDPHNIQLWLEYIKFQDTNSASTMDTGLSSRKSRIVMEIKMSIMEKAIAQNQSSVDLRIAQLELCQDNWDDSKITEAWENLLFVHTGNSLLWKRYLVYIQSRFSTFSVSKVTKAYHKCFKQLCAVLVGQLHARHISQDLEEDILEIFFHYCHFLRQSGHTEKAVASFQALIEYNLFCPESIKDLSASEIRFHIEAFWDSGVARIGENGAKGWKSWAAIQTMKKADPFSLSVDIEDLEETIAAKSQEKFKSWLDIESLREDLHWVPWRPDSAKEESEDDCEDLDRLILYDDIMPILFPLKNVDLHFTLVMSFFNFMGVPHLKSVFLNSASKDQQSELVYEKTSQVIDNLENGDTCNERKKFSEIMDAFLSNLFQQFIDYFNENRKMLISLLWFQHECGKTEKLGTEEQITKHRAKELRKFSKTLLKEPHNRSNLTLWNAYANLEWRLNKEKEAKSLLETALRMHGATNQKDPQKRSGVCLLFETYSKLILGFQANNGSWSFSKRIAVTDVQLKSALTSLCFLANEQPFLPTNDGEPSSTITVLKSRRKLEAEHQSFIKIIEKCTDNLTLHGICEYVVNFTNCFALFEYCSSSICHTVNIYSDARDICNKILAKSDITKYLQKQMLELRENLFAAEMRLIQHHMEANVCPLKVLRESMNNALSLYPNAVYFLETFVKLESRSRISGRVHRYFDKAMLAGTSVMPALFAILSEMQHQEVVAKACVLDSALVPETGSVHRLRALFERSVEAPVGQHCPLLWRLYLHFESVYGDNKRISGILYRSLQQCPWSKVLYKDGISLLKNDKLQELVDVMVEKEIRVQIPVEELDILLELPTNVPASPIAEDQTEDKQPADVMASAALI